MTHMISKRTSYHCLSNTLSFFGSMLLSTAISGHTTRLTSHIVSELARRAWLVNLSNPYAQSAALWAICMFLCIGLPFYGLFRLLSVFLLSWGRKSDRVGDRLDGVAFSEVLVGGFGLVVIVGVAAASKAAGIVLESDIVLVLRIGGIGSFSMIVCRMLIVASDVLLTKIRERLGP